MLRPLLPQLLVGAPLPLPRLQTTDYFQLDAVRAGSALSGQRTTTTTVTTTTTTTATTTTTTTSTTSNTTNCYNTGYDYDTRRLEKHADCVLLPSVLMIVTYYFCASHQSYCCSRCYQCDALSSLSNALTTGLSVVLAVPMPRNTRSMSATTRAHVQGPRLGQLWSWGQTSPPPVRAICRPRVKSEFRRLEGKTA